MNKLNIINKMVIGAICVLTSFASFGQYQVYNFKLNAKTTDAKGVVTSGCCGIDDEYCYREKKNVVIQGIIAGCGCGAVKANGTCDNAIMYLWDATRKIAITNVEAQIPWTVQRVGKKATLVEHFSSLKATYGDDDRYSFDVMMSGFGTYKENKTDGDNSYVSSVSGYFAGLSTAPYYLKKGACTACSDTPDQLFRSIAFSACTNCSDGFDESVYSENTPFYGVYNLTYNASKSNSVSKNGITARNLGLPSYVDLDDFVYVNIGE